MLRSKVQGGRVAQWSFELGPEPNKTRDGEAGGAFIKTFSYMNELTKLTELTELTGTVSSYHFPSHGRLISLDNS